MYTRESISTDRYTADEAGSARGEDAQNTTAASSDWSVRPSDDTVVDSVQSSHNTNNNLSRLNPAAAPFSFTGGAAAAAAAAGGDLVGAGGMHHHHHHHAHHHSGLLSDGSVDGGSGVGLSRAGMGSRGGGGSGVGAGMGMESGSPTSYGMMQGMMSIPYMMGGGGGNGGGGGHGGMAPRPSSMMDFSQMHGGGGGGSMGNGMGLGGRMGSGVGGGGMGGGSVTSPNSFLPPPGEDTDQQELMRLQQTNYRVKMLPPPLTYEVHRKIWSKNEYGDEDDDPHGMVEHPEEESFGSLLNEDPIDKEQRLEAYKQIMLRWYSHIHVLEGKSEVAKRLVRVRRACPSMEEVILGLQQQQSGITAAGSEGGDDDSNAPAAAIPPPPAAMVSAQQRNSPTDPLDLEEILANWSARCWDWWQETVKRKPRRARKQGELPLGSAPGLPTSASAPMVGAMGGSGIGDALLPHSLSARAMDMEATSPHLLSNNGAHGGIAGSYTHHSSYTSHPNGNGAAVDPTVAGGGHMPMAPSYTSFTDLSEEGGVDAPGRSFGHNSPQQAPPGNSSRGASYTSAPSAGLPPHQQQQQQQRSSPQQQPSQSQSQPGSVTATPPASMFTTNGIRAAAPRGNPDDFLENDHLTLAFTTELLKSLEE